MHVIIPTNNNWLAWYTRDDSQVIGMNRNYMFLRFEPVNFPGLPFERGQISPSRAHMDTLGGSAQRTGLEMDDSSYGLNFIQARRTKLIHHN
jgi:hypothetical protein